MKKQTETMTAIFSIKELDINIITTVQETAPYIRNNDLYINHCLYMSLEFDARESLHQIIYQHKFIMDENPIVKEARNFWISSDPKMDSAIALSIKYFGWEGHRVLYNTLCAEYPLNKDSFENYLYGAKLLLWNNLGCSNLSFRLEQPKQKLDLNDLVEKISNTAKLTLFEMKTNFKNKANKIALNILNESVKD